MRIRSIGDPAAPALVLIHGLSSSPRSWQRNLAALGAGRRVLIVELFPADAGPGFSIAGEASRLRRELEREAGPVAVIGHSLGGADRDQPRRRRRRHLVERLVLMSVPGEPQRRSPSPRSCSRSRRPARAPTCAPSPSWPPPC